MAVTRFLAGNELLVRYHSLPCTGIYRHLPSWDSTRIIYLIIVTGALVYFMNFNYYNDFIPFCDMTSCEFCLVMTVPFFQRVSAYDCCLLIRLIFQFAIRKVRFAFKNDIKWITNASKTI